jgi:Bax protein
MPLAQAKQTFIAAILPSILVAKHTVEMERLRIQEMQLTEWSPADSVFIAEMYRKYSAKSTQELLLKIGTLPTSIVLAQAAVESGWGRSRFFTRASNVFGIWSTDVHEPRIAASTPRDKKVIYVRAYEDISASIGDYFTVLARARAYRPLRKARQQTNDPLKLLPYLKSYSERKAAYIRLLKKVIEQNDLRRFDTYRINPRYLQRV